MNTYYKFCPNVFLAKCEEKHEKGGFFFYSITRADGYNCQERARRKAERYEQFASNADKRADDYFRKSEKDADFLSLGEPIKVGHHSEHRHRKMIDDAWRNTGKAVAETNKAEAYREKADGWAKHTEDINLSMPESVEYFRDKLEKATAYHQAMKDGKIKRSHSYSLTYAKKAVNEAQKNYDLAVKLWA